MTNLLATDPHRAAALTWTGPSLTNARLAMIMLHGRGGFAGDILALGEHLALPDIACLAPQAPGNSWWPQSFLAPLAVNEPSLSSALGLIDTIIENELQPAGFEPERIVLTGFSQGACLALEYAARAAARGIRFHSVFSHSGGLVGTAESDSGASEDLYGHAPKDLVYAGRLEGSQIRIGCHERDPHIPLARVHESTTVLKAMGAKVGLTIHPGAGHAVMRGDIAAMRQVLNG